MNSFNDPLLFIKAPPVYHRQTDIHEESTSIYEKPNSMSEQSIAILDKLRFLAKSFQRQAYRPLVFHLENGIHVHGEVEKVDDEFVTFLTGKDELVTYRVDQVEKIYWRGNILK